MAFDNRLKKILTGLTVPQEYCCLELENLQDRLNVFLTLKNHHSHTDVSLSHLFLGYKPLLIGIPIKVGNAEYHILDDENEVCLNLVKGNFEESYSWDGFPADKQGVATLILRKIHKKISGDDVVMFYEGVFGEHIFLNAFHQFVNRQKEKWQRRPAGNVGLPGNLLDQVRIAYATPRIISVVTISDGTLVNMFPTDLHGPLGTNFYISSLRIGGLANEQVECYKKLVVSEVETATYMQTYALGKNHMMPLRNEDQFFLFPERSDFFKIPLPEGVIKYRELKLVESFDHGIHRIHLYEVVNHKRIHEDRLTLAHIHQYYAQWRLDHHQQTTLFFR